MEATVSPRYPEMQVQLRSRNRWAVAAAVRQAMRRAGRDRQQIDGFLAETMAIEDPQKFLAACGTWVELRPAS